MLSQLSLLNSSCVAVLVQCQITCRDSSGRWPQAEARTRATESYPPLRGRPYIQWRLRPPTPFAHVHCGALQYVVPSLALCNQCSVKIPFYVGYATFNVCTVSWSGEGVYQPEMLETAYWGFFRHPLCRRHRPRVSNMWMSCFHLFPA